MLSSRLYLVTRDDRIIMALRSALVRPHGDLQTVLRLPESFYGDIHARLARELGLPALSFEGDTQLQMCAKYLAEPFDLWNDAHRGADYFVRTRLSLLELLFRGAEELVRKDDAARHPCGGLFARIVNGSARTPTGEARSAVSRAIEELNLRLQACGIGFTLSQWPSPGRR